MRTQILLAILISLLAIFLSSCFPEGYYPDNPGTYYQPQSQPQVQYQPRAPEPVKERCDCRRRCHKQLKPNARYRWETFDVCEYKCLNQYGAECR